MQPSLILCRTQEARHLALADAATLHNVKSRANAAAAAWAKEAVAAGLREDRKLRTLAVAEASASNVEPPSAEFHSSSENPDRGHAGKA